MATYINNIPNNLTEYPNSFKRQGAFPLEAYSVFSTLDSAQAYASTNAVAYVGQTIAVCENNIATLYIISDEHGTLVEVGAATEGDGSSISLEDDVLSISGFRVAPGATLPQKQHDGSIRWVTVDEIVEGDGNTKSVVEVADGSALTVTPVYDEESDTYTYILDVTSYDDTAITDRVVTLEGEVADHSTRLDKVEEFFYTADGESLDTALDALIEIQREIREDDASAANMLASITSNTESIKALEAVGAEKNVIASVSDELVISDSRQLSIQSIAQSKVIGLIDALKGKADTATTLAGYGITDAYTKSEVFTKGETLQSIADKVTEATGGESAAAVKLSLEAYRTSVDAEIWGALVSNSWVDEEGKYSPNYSTPSRLDSLESSVTSVTNRVNTLETADIHISRLTQIEYDDDGNEIETIVILNGGNK